MKISVYGLLYPSLWASSEPSKTHHLIKPLPKHSVNSEENSAPDQSIAKEYSPQKT